MKNFRINRKAISPIFATLILIAIAVIAGVVVYMFTSGTLSTMTGSGTAGQEKVAIQAVQVESAPAGGASLNTVVFAQAQGNAVPVTNAILKDAGGNVKATTKAIEIQPTPAPTPAAYQVATTLTNLHVDFTTTGLTSGTYTITLIGQGGGSFVSPTFSVTVG